MLNWVKRKLLEPFGFWTKYLWFRATRCMWGRHRWTATDVTDGSVYVVCRRCGDNRTATADEIAANPYSKLTAEEHAARRTREAEVRRWLKEHKHV